MNHWLQRAPRWGVQVALLGAISGVVACEALEDAINAAGLEVSVVGEVQVSGDMPGERSVVLYAPADNPDAFDTSLCVVEGVEVPGCSGRINVDQR